MPIGKSGKYHISPHNMKMAGDEPGGAEPGMAHDRPGDEETGGEGESGNGNHKHEIEMRPDGTAHSIHTNPDGSQEEAEHGSYEEATDHQDRMMKPEESEDKGEEDDERDEAGSGGEDLAGMYAGDCE